MNISSLSFLTSAANAPLARGSEIERTSQDVSIHERQVDSIEATQAAEGVGVTNEEQATGERDADGRRMWELPGEKKSLGEEIETPATEVHAKDPTGQAGSQLDLDG